jgi:predicted dehydrogenase
MLSSRRNFVAASAVFTAVSATRVSGANDRVRIGVIGTGGRGQYLMKALRKVAPEGVQFVAVCDVYDVRRAQAAQIAGAGAEQYLDYRQVVSRSDVDAVIVATPDHWHGPITVDALNAGKDVYVEKPMVHTPEDGLAIVRAARANKRIVQVGMQGRGMPHFLEAKEKYIDSGVIGKVGMARTWYTSNSGYVQQPPPDFGKKPDGLDWNRWLGRGPKVPWNPNIFFSPYKWLYYDGGMIMGIGIHVIDNARHWVGVKHPSAAVAGGGIWHYEDGRDTPDVVSFILDFPEKLTMTFHGECLTAPGVRTSAGVELRGTGGVLSADRYSPGSGYEYVPNSRFSKQAAAKVPMPPTNAETILPNWIECIRTRNKPVANEEEGYYSSVACFMANLAYNRKTRVVWNPKWDLPVVS